MRTKLQVLFEDKEIIVLIKPSGILSQTDRTNQPDLVRLLKSRMTMIRKKEGIETREEPYIAVVHRLDRNVRGIMVYAKTKRAAAGLSEELKIGGFQKSYQTVIKRKEHDDFCLSDSPKKLTSYLFHDSKSNCSMLVDRNFGKEAILTYRILHMTKEKAWVEVHLFTGRHHQIRVQMTEISYGIFGDSKYNKKETGARENEGRIALECTGLSFTHPTTKKRVSFQIEPEGRAFMNFSK